LQITFAFALAVVGQWDWDTDTRIQPDTKVSTDGTARHGTATQRADGGLKW